MMNLLLRTILITLLIGLTIKNALAERKIYSTCTEDVAELDAQFKSPTDRAVNEKLPYIISAFRTGQPYCIAQVFVYPFEMPEPLKDIENQEEMISRIDEVVDEKLIQLIANSTISDWEKVGWRGSMLNNGMVWAGESTWLGTISVRTEKFIERAKHVTETQKKYLHSSLHNMEYPVLSWNSDKFNIRVDYMGDHMYRYAVWPGNKSQQEKPDLILTNGEKIWSNGSLKYPRYEFKNGRYTYTVGKLWNPEWPDHKIGDLSVIKKDNKGEEALLLQVDYFEQDAGMKAIKTLNEERLRIAKDFAQRVIKGKPMAGLAPHPVKFRYHGRTDSRLSHHYCDITFDTKVTKVSFDSFEKHIKESTTADLKWLSEIDIDKPSFFFDKSNDFIEIKIHLTTFKLYFDHYNKENRLFKISMHNTCMA
ncbi:hypothetical protein ACUR5C_14940 [Aliikangiella sp. IMCC44653]